MIFKQEMVDKILAGEKTVTRRPVKEGYNRDFTRLGALPCRYEVNKTYAVQPTIEHGPGKGRGGKSVGRLRVLDVRRGPLGHQLTEREAAKEGFGGFRAFRDYWEGLYGSYDPAQLVDRIEFQLVGEGS